MSTTSPARTSPALEHLVAGGASLVANCGYGHGFSVREVLDTARRVTGVAVPDRRRARAGRATRPILVADSRTPPVAARLGAPPRRPRLHRRAPPGAGNSGCSEGSTGVARPMPMAVTLRLAAVAALLAGLIAATAAAQVPSSGRACSGRPAQSRRPVITCRHASGADRRPHRSITGPPPPSADLQALIATLENDQAARRAAGQAQGARSVQPRRRPSRRRLSSEVLDAQRRGRPPHGPARPGAGRPDLVAAARCRCCSAGSGGSSPSRSAARMWYSIGSQIGAAVWPASSPAWSCVGCCAAGATAGASCRWRPSARRGCQASLAHLAVNLAALLTFLAVTYVVLADTRRSRSSGAAWPATS